MNKSSTEHQAAADSVTSPQSLEIRLNMGLDIYHFKMVNKPVRKEDHILRKELARDMINKYGFEKYLKREKVDGIFSLIALLKTPEDLATGKEYLESVDDAYTDYKLKLVGTLGSCKDKIKEFEDKEGLIEFKKHTFEETVYIGARSIKYTDIAYKGLLEQDVFFTAGVGYQRKGMNAEFYNYFQNDTYYADKESFEKLLEFSDPENHMYNPTNVKENFIDKYEYGRSVLLLSW
jgi:hypothetical protein